VCHSCADKASKFVKSKLGNLPKNWKSPPNPAKLTDSRSGPYVAEFGDESWELDALSPTVLAGLIEGEIRERLDGPAWLAAEATEQEGRDGLAKVADRYEEVVDWLSA
jgi:hypothetical protein